MPFLDFIARILAWDIWQMPIDALILQLLLWFGWIPIAITFIWGLVLVWQSQRQGNWVGSLNNVLLAIDVPAATEQSPKALENLFANLYGSRSNYTWKETWIIGKVPPVFSFEIISAQGYIQFLVHTQTKYRDLIEASIYAQYPEAEITEVEDYTSFLPSKFPDDEYEVWGSELRLKEPNMFPIRTYEHFEDRISQEIKDPLGQILEQLSKMRPGEHFWIQFLAAPADNGWKKEAVEYIEKTYGREKQVKKSGLQSVVETAFSVPNALIDEAFGLGKSGDKKEDDPFAAFRITPAEKEKLEAVLLKSGKVGYDVKIRMVYAARKEVFNKGARAPMIKGMLLQYSHLHMNSFGLYGPVTPKDDYFWQLWSYYPRVQRLVNAYKSRSFGAGATPMILNTEELATLWHFPAIGIKAPLIKKAEARRAEPPTGLPSTFLEDTLPGMVPLAMREDANGSKKMEAVSLPSVPEPDLFLGDADVPRPTPPTRMTSASLPETSEDVPPNLPI